MIYHEWSLACVIWCVILALVHSLHIFNHLEAREKKHKVILYWLKGVPNLKKVRALPSLNPAMFITSAVSSTCSITKSAWLPSHSTRESNGNTFIVCQYTPLISRTTLTLSVYLVAEETLALPSIRTWLIKKKKLVSSPHTMQSVG